MVRKAAVKKMAVRQPSSSSKAGTSKGTKGGKGNVPRDPREPGKREGDCTYAGETYSEGAVIEQAGVKQKCVDGKWQDANKPEVEDFGDGNQPGNK